MYVLLEIIRLRPPSNENKVEQNLTNFYINDKMSNSTVFDKKKT